MSLQIPLKIIAKSRLNNLGKCESCDYFQREFKNNEWASGCSNLEYDNLFISRIDGEIDSIENETKFGTDEICPLWSPLNVSICKIKDDFTIHGPYFSKRGCDKCHQINNVNPFVQEILGNK